MSSRHLLWIVFSLLLPTLASAVPPEEIRTQGLLRSQAGVAVDGDYTLTFSLHDQLEDGAQFWSETHLSVPVTDGVFSATLGTLESFPASTFTDPPALWLQVKVGTDPALPRQPLLSVPFALAATVAHDVQCTGCITPEKTSFLSECQDGQVLKRQDGVWGCGTDENTGSLTAVNAGSGLTGGGDSGAVSLSIGTGAITATHLATDSVGPAEIKTNAVGASEADTSEIQARISGTCAVGSSIRAIADDGTVTCEPGATGDITDVTAGSGLTGGSDSGSVTLAVGTGAITATHLATDAVGSAEIKSNAVGASELKSGAVGASQANTSEIQRRVTGTCALHEAVRTIAEDGSLTCVDYGDGDITGVTAGSGLTGGSDSGHVNLAIGTGAITANHLATDSVNSAEIKANAVGLSEIDTSVVQQRVSGSCPSGSSIRTISSTGTVTCQTDSVGGSSLSCVTRSENFSGVSGIVSCLSGEIMTGGGFFLSDGNNNSYTWNTAAARPHGNGYFCSRNIYTPGSSLSTCYARCCKLQ